MISRMGEGCPAAARGGCGIMGWEAALRVGRGWLPRSTPATSSKSQREEASVLHSTAHEAGARLQLPLLPGLGCPTWRLQDASDLGTSGMED